MKRKIGPEEIIQENLFKHVRSRAAKGAIIWHTYQSSKVPIQEAARRKRLGVLAGIPDVLAYKDRQLYVLEIKSETGHPTPEQICIMQAFQSQGAIVFCAYGLDEAIGFLEKHGLLTGEAAIVKPRSEPRPRPPTPSVYDHDFWSAG